MRPLVAILAAAYLSACAGPRAIAASGEGTGGLRAVGCTVEAPCVYSDGVWQPTAMAAETAGWGAGLSECKARLEKCDSTGLDTVGAWLLVGAGVLAGGLTVAAGYELRDWLKR